ncbi:MAG: polymerase alpha subunit [Pseudomonadota bacterium]|jgi:DNA polymerase-3 subunit alpha
MFVHLLVHTEYSIVDSTIPIKPLLKTVKEMGMPACAVTDRNNLFSMVKFYSHAQTTGIKPIIGADILIRQNSQLHRLVLLCQNHQGYLNLSRLVSRAYLEGQQQGIPAIELNWLNNHTDNLIALSGGLQGDIGQALSAQDIDLAVKNLKFWQQAFPDRFYLQLQRTGRAGEEDYLHAAVNLALENQIPVVAVNDVVFLKPDDFDAHEVRVCIHDGHVLEDARRPRRYNAQQYLRSPAEMIELFEDLPEAIENTSLIAQRCNLELTLGKNYLPIFPTGEKTAGDFLKQQAEEGLEKRLIFLFGDQATSKRKPYDERLEIELKVIIEMDFPGYFLIVADFIQWAKQNGVPVGPGRGSGAGSLVAYALGITDLDPLQYDLLFERFLNPERVSMPDFDIDFCMEGRDRVIDYVAQRYGREKVSQIITYGTMAAKAVIRDVGRVLSHPYGFVDQIAKLIPFEIGITLEKALEQEAVLRKRYQEEDAVKTLIDMAKKLEGLTKNAGKHAGGVVIAPTALTDFSPLYCEENDPSIVTQFDKNDVEAIGLVKFDFLGLRTLTIIDWALQNIKQSNPKEKLIDILKIPLDDKATFDMYKTGKTTAVFQLESRGMQELIKRMKPDCFEDLIALVALYRPGPLQSGMVDDFINRKQARAKIEYPHPSLIPILKPTYGVIVYQEQVMQIAQVLAGYTLGGADLLRRAMGKKKPEEMAKQRSTFVEGSIAQNVDKEIAEAIFDLMEKFAAYGFNKSHSAAYALVSYQTAWLKTHYPAAFMAAVLSSDMDNTDKVVGFIEECKNMGLQILLPDVNFSDYKFTVSQTHSKTIRYGLGAIKGAGESALENIVAERKENGLFKDLFDFCKRVDLRKCNRRVLENLIKAGALDQPEIPRNVLLASLETALKIAEQHNIQNALNQDDMFSFGGSPQIEKTEEILPYTTQIESWSIEEKLNAEKEVLGLYLSGHPFDPFKAILSSFTKPLHELKVTGRNQKIKVAGLINEIRTKNGQAGKMAFVSIDDQTSRLDIKIYSEIYENCKHLLQKDQVLIAEGEIIEDSYTGQLAMNASKIWNMESAQENNAKRLILKVNGQSKIPNFIENLALILKPHCQTGCTVSIQYQNPDNLFAEFHLGQQWQVRPNAQLLQDLSNLMGKNAVQVIY